MEPEGEKERLTAPLSWQSGTTEASSNHHDDLSGLGMWRLSRGILRDLRGSISSPTAHAGGLSMEVRPSAPPAAIGYYYLDTIIQSIPQWASVSLRLLRPEERGVVLPQRGSRLNGDEG